MFRVVIALVSVFIFGMLAAAQTVPRRVPDTWAHDKRLEMEDLGWDFRTDFGTGNRNCYALPPRHHWPDGDWADQKVRDQAVRDGVKRFPPQQDGLCHAEDALGTTL